MTGIWRREPAAAMFGDIWLCAFAVVVASKSNWTTRIMVVLVRPTPRGNTVPRSALVGIVVEDPNSTVGLEQGGCGWDICRRPTDRADVSHLLGAQVVTAARKRISKRRRRILVPLISRPVPTGQ